MKTHTSQKSFIPVGLFLLNLLLAGGLFILFYRLHVPLGLSCTYPLTGSTLIALGVPLILNVAAAILWRKTWFKLLQLSLLLLAGLCLMTVWLGSYPYSPLDFSRGNFSVLQGFLITRQGWVDQRVTSGDILVLQSGSLAGISLLSDLPDMECQWTSLNGGAWDDPGSCDTAYSVPFADYDILTVRIVPGCKLPPLRGQLKISIMP